MPTPVLHQIHHKIEEYPLQRKILITRSFAQGHQWIQRMSRELGPISNVQIQTMESLGLAHARFRLFEAEKTYVDSGETCWIVMSVMLQLSKKKDCYVPASMVTPGVVQSFYNAVRELREACVNADQLETEQFEHAAKGEYMRKLLTEYEAVLCSQHLVDFAALPAFIEPSPEVLVLVDGSIRLSAAAQRLLEQLAPKQCFILKNDNSAASGSGLPYDAVTWFHALGPLAEAKEVLRRVASQEGAWDETELILSNYEEYAPKLYALSRRLGVELTFSQGLPLNTYTLGRAALLFLDWLESECHMDHLLVALKHGMIRIAAEGFHTNEAIRVLEKSGIGWGRDRYSLLETYVTDQKSQQLAAAWLANEVKVWLQGLPDRESMWSCSTVVDSLIRFLRSCHEPVSRGDTDVLQFMHRLQEQLQRWGGETIGSALAIRFVRQQLESCSVEAAGVPEAGRLFVSSVENGGHTGRNHTYILGMNEDNWSMSVQQDPVLLDEERERLHPTLETSGQRVRRTCDERSIRLCGIRGAVTMSFSSIRTSDQSESNPAYEMLHWYRVKTKDEDAAFDALGKSLGEPVGWINKLNPLIISVEDYLCNELISDRRTLRDGYTSVLDHFSSLRHGITAMNARKETEIGAFDGVLSIHLHQSGYALNSYSASKLETYAKCPLQFFYQNVLEIRPKDMVVFDRSRWLDPMQRGSLLHKIFFTYMSHTVETGAHDRTHLDAVTDRVLAETLQNVPAPSPLVYAKECGEIRQDIDMFWLMEQRRQSRPVLFELELHREEGLFQLELSEESVLPLQGFVDRIDETAPHQYQVIDYKTGNPKFYDDDVFFAGGKQIQHALYAIAAEQWLRRTGGDPLAVVTAAGYAFPTQRGRGEEKMRSQEGKKTETIRVISQAVKAIESGLFPPAEDPKICGNCDYAAVCGSHAEWKKDARHFPQNRERLAPLLEVSQSG